jgi:hypothetical protein
MSEFPQAVNKAAAACESLPQRVEIATENMNAPCLVFRQMLWEGHVFEGPAIANACFT